MHARQTVPVRTPPCSGAIVDTSSRNCTPLALPHSPKHTLSLFSVIPHHTHAPSLGPCSNGGCPNLSFLSTAAGQSHEATAAASGSTLVPQPGPLGALLRLLPDTSRCLAGWPLLPMAPAVRLYYAFELAWYLQLLVKHHLGASRSSTMG